MDIIVPVAIGLVNVTLATLGVILVLRPPKGNRARNYLLGGFISIGLLGVLLAGFQTYQARAKTEAESAARRAIREKLVEFVKEGLDLKSRCENRSEPPPVAEANQWAERTEAFLRSSLDESYVARFRNSSGLPMTGTLASSRLHSNLWTWLTVRLARLDEFLKKLSK